MNIGEMLIWASTNLLLLIPTVIGLVILVRWFHGRPAFTDPEWAVIVWSATPASHSAPYGKT